MYASTQISEAEINTEASAHPFIPRNLSLSQNIYPQPCLSMSNPLGIFVSTSYVGDLSYQAPTSQVAGMAHTFVTGRKTFKTSKGKNEAVWPSHIEAALFDALEKYRPASSGDPRLLRRFPKRNRFISDHIFKITGKLRTPKQVGSRLQQLRDTCQEEKVLKLLSRREFPPENQTPSLRSNRSESPTPSLSSSSTSTTPASSPFTAEFPDLFQRSLNLSSPVTAAGAFSDSMASPPTVLIEVASPTRIDAFLGALSSHTSEPNYLVEFNFPTDGPYPSLNHGQRNVRLAHSGSSGSPVPSVKILCANVLPDAVHSVFCVFLDDTLLHHETTDLELLPDIDQNGNVQYGTKLVPQYWSTLCHINDLSRYTITQDVMKVASIDAGQTIQEAVLFGVSYKFTSPASPSASCKSEPYPDPIPSHLLHAGDPHMGPGIPVYAQRPLLLDTINTMLSVPGQPDNHVWYDQCGINVAAAAAAAHHEPPFDFLGVGETGTGTDHVELGRNWMTATHSLYLNLAYNL
ncbi:hypothetical protein D9615_002195 [Tricholomella constricta]|uniref:TEA domain-containing protein n=1 Tax=Tricholomella constricta TaxID=117010 RepID=A0A8H5M9U2_9AGAR|nr:hypothetical protein D9615_002195 [Tricholomella constricta]